MARFGRIRMVTRFVPLLLLLGIFAFIAASCGGGGQTTSEGGATGGAGTVPRTTGGGTVPAELTSAALELTPSGDSGVSGSARLTDASGGVQVELYVLNLQSPPSTEHLAHIHQGGTCADDRAGNGAPVEYPLNSVFTGPDGTGSSTTTISNVTVAQLFSGPPKYINVHAEQTGNETPPGISCADLSSAGGSAPGGTTSGRD